MDPLLEDKDKKPQVELTKVSKSLYPDLDSQKGILEKKPYFQFEEDESSKAILFNSG
jgi:hypothetical protein